MSKAVAFALLILLLCGCGNTRARSAVDADALLSAYDSAVIYPSEHASFVELELMQIFRGFGYRIVGVDEKDKGAAIGVRYTFQAVPGRYVVTLQLVDDKTSKTLATIEGNGSSFNLWTGHQDPNREKATQQATEELRRVLPNRAVGK